MSEEGGKDVRKVVLRDGVGVKGSLQSDGSLR